MKVIVGLGNPGEKYANVRHNLGFMVLDHLVKELEAGELVYSDNLKGFYCKKMINGEEVEFIKPSTYMNQSGMSVIYALSKHLDELKAEDIIVIHDELDLPLGKIKIRQGGSAAGHHGVESIMEAIDSDQFIRVRLGIGNLKTKGSEHKQVHVDTNKFVLEPFTHSEKPKVKHMLKQAVSAIQILLDKGLEYAQNQHN